MKLLKGTLIGALILCMIVLLGGSSVLASQKTIKLKGGTPWGENHRNSLGLGYFAKQLKEMSKGNLIIKTYFGGSLVKGKTEIDVLKSKVVDIASVTVPYHPGVIPDYIRASITVPFVTDFKSWPWIWKNTDWYSGYLKKLGLHPLYACYGELVVALVKPIENIEDPSLSGRKIRAPGLGFTEFIKILGGDTVTMPSAEAPAALATGLAQGLYTTLDTWESLGLNDVCPYVYVLNVPFTTMHCMTEAKYKSLPDQAKKMIDEAAAKTTANQIKWAETYRAKLMAKYKGHKKVKIHVLDDKQMGLWKEKIKPFYEWARKKFDPEMSKYLADCEKAWKATHTTEFPGAK